MHRISARSVVQRALLCALALLLALAPISGAAAATIDEADATEAALAQEEATEQPTVEADPTDPPEPLPVEVTEEPDPAPAPEAAPKDDEAPADDESDAPVARTAVVEDEAKLEAAADDVTAAADTAGPASGAGVQPTYLPGNPTCGGLYPNEIKIEPVRSGTYTQTFTSAGGSFTASVTISVNGGAQTFSFSGATPPVGAVVVKGGPNANLYEYPGGATADSGLHAPVNGIDGNYYGLSHISFCFPPFKPDVEIEKWIVDGAGANRETHAVVSGSTVTWRIRVTNTGTQNLTNVAVSDQLAASCNRSIGNLAAGAAPVEYTCTSLDVTTGFTNVATVTTGQGVDDTDDASVTVLRPDISITKSPKNQEVAYGGTATWTIVVKNTGEVPLTGVVVTDEKAPDCAFTIGNLAVGAEAKNENCTLDNVTGSLRNIAVVDSNETGPKEDHGDVTVPAPALTANWTCPTRGQGSIITGTTNRPLASVTLTFARNGGTQTITTTQTGNFSFQGTGEHAGKVISSASIVSSVTSLNTTVTPTQQEMEACFDDKPSISIDKRPVGWDGTGTETQQVTSGEAARWTITVKNTGDVELTNVKVTDPEAGDCERLAIGTLAPGESAPAYTCSRDNVTTAFTNVATATGTPPIGNNVTASDPSPVTVFTPALTAAWGCPTPGQGSIITGTTNVPLSSVTLTFDRNGGTETITTTDTGAFSFKGTGANAGKVISSAVIVSSVSTLNRTVTPTADQMAACYDGPAITIDKRPVGWNGQGTETQQVTSGQAANWTITVTNTGDVALTNVRVTDPLASDCVLTGAEAFSLGIGGSRTYVCDEPNVTAGFVNTATATGTSPLNKDVSDSDDSPVTVFTPALTAAWGCPTPGQGSVITGTTNVPLSSVTLTFARNGGTETITTTQTGAFTFAGSGANAGKVISSAQIVSSVSSLNRTVTPTQAQIDACYNAPGITIVKSPLGWNGQGTETQQVTSGQAANWTITVTNTGDVALTNVRVTDPLASGCDLTGAQAFSLAIGASRVYNCTRTNVTSGFTNVATATGTPPTGGDVSDSDDSPVTVPTVVETPVPAIAIVKAHTLTPLVDGQTINAGGTASWLIRVTNTGNTTLNNVTVTDPQAPGCNRNLGTLAPGASADAYPCSLAGVPVSFTNRADVVGTSPANTQVTASDTAPVTVLTTTGGGSPAIALIKTVPTPECPRPGDSVIYRFEIRNTGDQTLTQIALNDPLLGGAVTLPATTLPAGQTMVATKAYTLTAANIDAGQLANSATVSSRAPSGLAVNNTGQAVMMLEPCADVLLEKDGPATAQVGEQITYTFTVTNTGNVTLTNVRIFDERLGISGLLVNPSTLAPNQKGTATATYTVTEADAEAREILNTAFVRARTPGDTEIDDEDDHLVPVPPVFEAPDPALSLEKDGPARATVGDTVTYRFTVTNTGETTLTNVSITDPFLGLDRLAVRPSTLAPDEQGTATATYVITEADGEARSVYNTAVARGRAPDSRIVRDRDDHTVPVPAIPPVCPSPPCGPPPPPPELPATGLGTTGFALTALLSLALGGVLLGIAGTGGLQTAMANATVNADSPMLAMLRQWNLAPKPGGSQARRRRRR